MIWLYLNIFKHLVLNAPAQTGLSYKWRSLAEPIIWVFEDYLKVVNTKKSTVW